MNDKTTVMRAFNTHFFDFLDDVIRIYPENKEISSAKISFEIIQQGNPSAIIKVWYKFVYIPYQQVIDDGNINFFFEKDYGSDLSNVANSDKIMKIIEKVRQPLINMDPVNKDHAAKYVQNLSKLSIAYNDLVK